MKILSLSLFASFLMTVSLIGQKTVPSVEVNNRAGEAVNIAEYVKSDGPKIISMWATWCGPCRMELNALKEVYPKWKEKYGVEIIAISVDVPSMLKRANGMFEKNGWDYTFMHDYSQEMMTQLGIRGIPYSMLLDKDGNIASVQKGYFQGYEKQLEKKISKL